MPPSSLPNISGRGEESLVRGGYYWMGVHNGFYVGGGMRDEVWSCNGLYGGSSLTRPTFNLRVANFCKPFIPLPFVPLFLLVHCVVI